MGWSHEQGPHVGVGLRPAGGGQAEAMAFCALKEQRGGSCPQTLGSGSGERGLRIWGWDCRMVTKTGSIWGVAASYVGSHWEYEAASNAWRLWVWQLSVPWRKPCLGGSLDLEGAKQWFQSAVFPGEEGRWRPAGT
jgi:hypothetical protein